MGWESDLFPSITPPPGQPFLRVLVHDLTVPFYEFRLQFDDQFVPEITNGFRRAEALQSSAARKNARQWAQLYRKRYEAVLRQFCFYLGKRRESLELARSERFFLTSEEMRESPEVAAWRNKVEQVEAMARDFADLCGQEWDEELFGEGAGGKSCCGRRGGQQGGRREALRGESEDVGGAEEGRA